MALVTSLSDFAIAAHSTAQSHGFWTNYNPLTVDTQLVKLALIVSEIGEAVEAVRKADMMNFQEELADIIIRTLDLSESLGFDIEHAVREKMQKNADRPFMHGKLA
jgi:NTP pyrophosphatase (non-canonical NTP hydrolase)